MPDSSFKDSDAHDSGAYDSGTHESPVARVTIEKRIVRRQMNRSGNIMLSALEPLTEDEFSAPGESGISAAWTVGHVACVMDLFTSWLDNNEGLFLPRATHDVFNSLDIGPKSGATKAELVDPTRFPKADVLLLMRQAQVKTLRVLDNFDARLWESPAPEVVPETLPTYGSVWEHLGVHTYWHLGELSVCVPRFHGTYTVNTVLHYFFPGIDGRGG